MDTKKHSKMLMAAVLTAATYGVMTSAAHADPASLIEAIADSTAVTYTVVDGDLSPFSAGGSTALGTLVGDGRTFTINGGSKTIDGSYNNGETQYGSGITVGSGQTLTVNNFTFTNFDKNGIEAGAGVIKNGGILNLTDVTMTGNKVIGDSTGNNDVYSSGTMTLSGTNNISGIQNEGTMNVTGTNTIGSLIHSSELATSVFNVDGGTTTITGDLMQGRTIIAETAKLVLLDDYISGDITNNNTDYGLTFNGSNTNSRIVYSDIDGEGKTLIDEGAKVVLVNNKSIEQEEVYVKNGSLLVDAGGLQSDVKTDASGSVTLKNSGTFNKSITGSGTTTIQSGANVTVGENGSIGTGVVIAEAFGENPAATLTAALEDVTGNITNHGTFNTHGVLNKNIAGADGTTVLDGELAVTANSTIAGTLNMNNQTINMQDEELENHIYTSAPASYQTLTVGNLTGTGNLKIDANMANGTADKIHVTGNADDNNATLTVTSVNIANPAQADTTQANYITYADGNIDNITFGNGSTSIGTITSDNHRYTFSNGETAGTLNVTVRDTIATLADFIQGNIDDDNNNPPAVTVNTYSLVDDYTTTTDLGTTANAYNPAVTELNVNLNNHTLSGTTVDNTDPDNPAVTDGPHAGVTVANGYTLNLDGGTTGGTVSGFTTALTLNDDAKAVVNNVTFTGNTNDIVNNAGYTIDEENNIIEGLIFNGTNNVDTISGSGGTLINGNLTVTSTADDALTQDYIQIADSGSLTANANTLNTNNINNSGDVNLGSGTLDSRIWGTGDVTITGAVTNATTMAGNNLTINAAVMDYTDPDNPVETTPAASLTSNAGDLSFTEISNNGALTLTGDVADAIEDDPGTPEDESQPADNSGVLSSAVSGEGKTTIDGNIVSNVAIATDIAVNNGKSLEIGASNVGGAVDNAGTLKLNDGTLSKAVSGDGTTEIAGDVVSNSLIAQAITIDDGESLTTSASNVGGDVTNAAGTLTLNGGTLSKAVSGNGTTDLVGNVTVAAAVPAVEDDPETTDVDESQPAQPAGSISQGTVNVGEAATDTTPAVVGNVTNNGNIQADQLNVNEGSTLTNNGEMTATNVNVTGTPAVADDPETTDDESQPAVLSQFTNNGDLTAGAINVEDGKFTALGSNSSTEVDEINVENGTVEVADGASIEGNTADNATMEFTGNDNTLLVNAENADTTLSGVNVQVAPAVEDDPQTTDVDESQPAGSYDVVASSANDNAVTIDNAIADAASVTATDGTDLTLTKTATDSINKNEDAADNAKIVMGDGSLLTLDNKGQESVINNNIVGAEDNENGYAVNITDSEGYYTDTELASTIQGATDVNADTDIVINAGSDDSTSDRIDGANLNLSDEAYATVSTTADNFTIDNNVKGENNGEELILSGKQGEPGSASNSGTKFSVADGTTISDATVEVENGELLLNSDDNFNNSDIVVDGSTPAVPAVEDDPTTPDVDESQPAIPAQSGATLSTQNDSATEVNTPVTLEDGAQVKVDANAISGNTDKFNNLTQDDDDTAILTDVAVQDLDKVVHHTTKIDLKNGTGIDNLELSPELLDKKITAMTPIRKMTASFGEDGMLTILPSSGHNNYKDFNPAALATPIAAQLGGYLIQLNSYDEAFRNMDMYMLMTKKQRQALKFRNKVASIEGGNFVFDNSKTPTDSAAGWFRPYASFEKVGLHNGPKVENNMYGSFFGGESSMKDLGHGWDGIWGAYVGYNGAHQHYSNVSMYENGGTLGLVGMAYKDNFFVGGTINTGANAGEASTSFGSDDFAMIMAGVAAKAGYNWELADGKFVIQPSMVAAYTFVNTFDYTNSAGVRINSDPLNAIMIEPGLKFIGNLKNGWQPYAGVSVVINLMDKADMKANDISLPSMSVNPYVKYGVGVRKTWGERFTGFLQTFFMNGGRTGVGFQGGFRFAIGQDGSHKMSDNAGKAPELKQTKVNLSAMK